MIVAVGGLPDPDWYLDNVLVHAEPGVGGRIEIGRAEAWQARWRERAADLAGTPATDLALTQGFVVGRGQLLGLGWRDHDLRRVVRRREWSRPDRSVLSPVVVTATDYGGAREAHALRSCAAALLRPNHKISGRSAAVLHGLPTFVVPQLPVLTTQEAGSQGRHYGVLVRGASLDATAVTSWFGAPVLEVARTVVDLARSDPRDGIMSADAALRESLVTRAELDRELIGAAGWPGIRQARDIVPLADPLAESALESIVRLALHRDRFPPPRLQFPIGGYRVDFCWPEYRLILEADGRGKYTADELWREKQREARLRAAGYRVERVLWSDVVADWPAMSSRLWALIRG